MDRNPEKQQSRVPLPNIAIQQLPIQWLFKIFDLLLSHLTPQEIKNHFT